MTATLPGSREGLGSAREQDPIQRLTTVAHRHLDTVPGSTRAIYVALCTRALEYSDRAMGLRSQGRPADYERQAFGEIVAACKGARPFIYRDV